MSLRLGLGLRHDLDLSLGLDVIMSVLNLLKHNVSYVLSFYMIKKGVDLKSFEFLK